MIFFRLRGRRNAPANMPPKPLLSTLLLLLTLFLAGCLGKPAGVVPVSGFEVDRYLGRWYEIARLDHSFERGLSQVTADYARQPDGSIRVANRGYSEERGVWKEAVGTARFVEGPDQGYLKVSFFGPFYGSYVVFELDEEGYQYAFVSGPNTSYLWLLARSPTVPASLKEQFTARVKQLGFPADELIWLEQK